ncbi:DBH-like monooxygenase protein 1 [Pecten maximus]|uniref:DBH-like monooxygenase protein 1 n=1 Tax=Pecten maximus TaxID=6579 RepID=UPI0014585D6E|nr:DBH-like monooxygenase protein 1 [Pecten maximus]
MACQSVALIILNLSLVNFSHSIDVPVPYWNNILHRFRVQNSLVTPKNVVTPSPENELTSPRNKVTDGPTQTYEHRKQLDQDGDYILFWRTNDTHITFETHVKTHGYVGFGISRTGGMFPADVVFGWVADGKAFLKDCHTIGYVAPIVDTSQDWLLEYGAETDENTILKFTRKIDTCDSDDIKITDDTAKLIFSYHPDDPASMTSLPWHGTSRRGTKSLMLLSTTLSQEASGMPDNVITHDFLNQHYLIPPVPTTYRCTTFDFPDLGKKHHVVKVEANIQEGHRPYVHHMLLYHCANISLSLANHTYMCYDNAPAEFVNCRAVFAAWEIGGGAFYYPPDVGMSLGTDKDPRFFILETHYNNQANISGIVDSSGIRISYTPEVRKYDAGMLITGFFVDPAQIIPPYEKSFISKGYCSEQDLARGVPEEGVNVFAVLQHSHLLAKQFRTRVFRNGSEIEPFADDNYYDFNFQEFHYLKHERKLKKGDSIEVDCDFDSSSRTSLTLGGLSTYEEMCLSFLLYYPRMDVEACWSVPLYQTVHNDTHLAQEQMYKWDWSKPEVRRKFDVVMNETLYRHSSFGNFLDGAWQFHDFYPPHRESLYASPNLDTCFPTP